MIFNPFHPSWLHVGSIQQVVPCQDWTTSMVWVCPPCLIHENNNRKGAYYPEHPQEVPCSAEILFITHANCCFHRRVCAEFDRIGVPSSATLLGRPRMFFSARAVSGRDMQRLSLHSDSLTWKWKMACWMTILLYKQAVFRFHVMCLSECNTVIHFCKSDTFDTWVHPVDRIAQCFACDRAY